MGNRWRGQLRRSEQEQRLKQNDFSGRASFLLYKEHKKLNMSDCLPWQLWLSGPKVKYQHNRKGKSRCDFSHVRKFLVSNWRLTHFRFKILKWGSFTVGYNKCNGLELLSVKREKQSHKLSTRELGLFGCSPSQKSGFIPASLREDLLLQDLVAGHLSGESSSWSPSSLPVRVCAEWPSTDLCLW